MAAENKAFLHQEEKETQFQDVRKLCKTKNRLQQFTNPINQ